MPPLLFTQPCGLRVWESELTRDEFQITTGFCYSRVEGCKDAFRFAALIGLDNFSPLFHDCAELLGEESFFVLEYYPDKIPTMDSDSIPEPTVFYSPYMPTDEILTNIQPYFNRLMHDGFVGFGLANSRRGVELFYSEEKAFTCFTANHIRTMNIFDKYGLLHQEELLFPADFAHDHLSLVSIDIKELPEKLQCFTRDELDYVNYCSELVEMFEMQSTTTGDEFFLSGHEQDYIATLLTHHPELEWTEDDEFVHLLLDWKEFVRECSQGFTGDYHDYGTGLHLRDIIATVIDRSDATLSEKLSKFIEGADAMFKRQLMHTARQMADNNVADIRCHQRFWRWGVIKNQGTALRRDLIRNGWFSKNIDSRRD